MAVSANFGFLAPHDGQLDRLGALAERFFSEDASTSILKIRQFGEVLAQLTAARLGMWGSPEENQNDLLRRLRDRGALSREVLDLFHLIRKAGNQAAHDDAGDHRLALSCLKNARILGIWFHRTVSGDRAFSPGPFVPPADPRQEGRALMAELERLRVALAERQSEHERIAAESRAETERRLSAEERVAKAEAERQEWERLAREVDADRSRLEAELVTAQAAAAARPAEALQEVAQAAQEIGQTLDIDERETRRLIDERLRAAGWTVDSETITHAAGVRPQRGEAVAIAEWPTANGPADYVLFVDGAPLATVEAKRRNHNVSQVIDQAQRYAAGLAPSPGVAPLDGAPWDGFGVPFAFSSNGRSFLRQIPELTGIWFRDLRRPTNLRRPLEDWYTPGGLKQLLEQDIEAAREALLREPFAYNFGLRDYQEKAIRSIEQAIAAGQDHILVAMATGTGKTKTCIGLIYRLLKANRFRRVLFLVDRTALGDQAAGAFKTTKMEQQRDFADIYEIRELGDLTVDAATRVHIATVQALVKRVLYPADGPPPIDQYDCIVVDECHRGYLLDREMG
ncbi:MAG: DEAD/DEAH box helicase family protein, partial [Alphaproteobacteria bacterium]|nr:DEAD/DEAH box helicase family protein [Alphaproteobacteria bacterium]